MRPSPPTRKTSPAKRDGLTAFGVSADRSYVDHGLTGTNRERPGLREVLAACRTGDTLVVTKLDRLARSLPDAREILDDLTKREVKLSLGGSVHGTREGMKVAKPKLNPRQEARSPSSRRCALFGVTRSTVYRAIERDARRLPGPGAALQATIIKHQ